MKPKNEAKFSPSICVTHDCNLNCLYCYQKHDKAKMSSETAMKCIDWIFENAPRETGYLETSFIGGEPLLEFGLIKKVVEYTFRNKITDDGSRNIMFFASTNGTLLDDSMKGWLLEHKHHFCLGLSLDGTRDTHNFNRSQSFDQIDIDFFLKTWPRQSVKMTLSKYSLRNLAKDVKYIHSLGFAVRGVNLCEGDFDWNDERLVGIIIPQLKALVDFYVENDSLVSVKFNAEGV